MNVKGDAMNKYFHFGLYGTTRSSKHNEHVLGIWKYKDAEMLYVNDGKIVKRELLPLVFAETDVISKAMKARLVSFFIETHGEPESLQQVRAVFRE
jgi:hypothetical protein